jgi:hypothetical protein
MQILPKPRARQMANGQWVVTHQTVRAGWIVFHFTLDQALREWFRITATKSPFPPYKL